MAGTWAGSPTFSGNPVFSGSPAFNMTGGPFCVQETAGVLSSTGSTCGSGGGGGPGTGTPNYFAAWSPAGNTLVSVGSAISGQIPVIQNGSAPIASSPALVDSGSSPVVTSPYTIQCDSATSILDRSTTMRFQTGANAVTVPLSSGSGCAGMAVILMADGVSVTFSRSGSDTFSIFNGAASSDGATSFTLTDGQFATLNLATAGIWEARIGNAGVTSVATGSGLTGGTITGTGTVSIANGGITNAMLAGSIALTNLASQAANTVLGKFTSGSGSPTATAVATCSGNNQGEIYTTNTGFGCGANFGQLNVASTWSALQTFGTNFSVGGVTAAGATGSGNVVFATTPTVTSATLTGASTVVPSGATLTIQSGGTLTCAGGSTCPTGTGTVTHTAGALASAAFVTGNAGADIQTASTGSTMDASGNAVFAGTLGATAITGSGKAIFSAAGAVSAPGLSVSGTPYTAGNSTTNLPQVFEGCNGAAAVTTWSGNGTFFGINPCTGFTGNLVDLHAPNGGASLFSSQLPRQCSSRRDVRSDRNDDTGRYDIQYIYIQQRERI